MWEPYAKTIAQSELFCCLSWEEIERILSCSGARLRRYPKKETVLPRGIISDSIYLILEGQLKSTYDTGISNDNLTGKLAPPACFGYLHSLLKTPNLMGYITLRESLLLELSADSLFRPCANACPGHSKVTENLMTALSREVVVFSRKIHYMHIRGLRERLVAFLLEQSSGRSSFELGMNRTEMAEYLGLSRASMTRELSLLRQEGLLDFSGPHFVLLQPDALYSFVIKD